MAIGYVEWVNPNALPTGLTCFMGVQSVGFLATEATYVSLEGIQRVDKQVGSLIYID